MPEPTATNPTGDLRLEALRSHFDLERVVTLGGFEYHEALDLFDELLEIFLDDTPGRVQKLKQAAESADEESVRRLAHSIKGSSSNLCAEKLSGLCARLEEKLRSGGFDPAARALVGEISGEFDALIASIRKYRGTSA